MSLPCYGTYRHSDTEWLGVVPARWTVSPLKRHAKVVTERTERRTRAIALEHIESWSGRLLLSAAETEFEGEGIRFEPGDVLYGKLRPYLAKVLATDFSGEAVGDFHVIRPTGSLQCHFLSYALRTKEIVSALNGSTYGAKMPRVSWEFMGSMALAIPPRPEQAAIVTFLDRETGKIDALVEEQKRLIDLLKEKRQSVISHAVTKGLNPDAPMKNSGIEWLGEVPAHWEVRKLSSLSTKITNGYVGPTRDVLVDAGVRYLQSLHIKNNRIIFDPPYFVPLDWSEQHAKSILEAGDVLIVQTGDIGQVAVVTDEFVGCNCHALIIVAPLRSAIRGEWLSWVLNADYGLHSLLSIQTGALHPHLNCGNVKDLFVPLPPMDEQQQIVAELATSLTKFDELIGEAETATALLQERRSALISAAVTGKIDVRSIGARTQTDRSRLRLILGATIIEAIAHKPGSGRTKAHKITYLAEAHAGIQELQGAYTRQAAGPLDWSMITETEAQFQSSGHITVEQADGHGTFVAYKVVGQRGAFRDELRNALGSRSEALHRLITDLADLDTKSVEAIATLYAVWNDALIDGSHPTDQGILAGVLNDWHPDKKKKFTANELQSWLDWMRRHHLVPKGQAPRTQLDRLFA